MEGSAAAEKHVADFCMELAGDLAYLHEAYERNIQNLGGIFSPIPGCNTFGLRLHPLADLGGGLLARGLRKHQRELCFRGDRRCAGDGRSS